MKRGITAGDIERVAHELWCKHGVSPPYVVVVPTEAMRDELVCGFLAVGPHPSERGFYIRVETHCRGSLAYISSADDYERRKRETNDTAQ